MLFHCPKKAFYIKFLKIQVVVVIEKKNTLGISYIFNFSPQKF